MELILFAIEPEHLLHVAETAGARSTFELPEKFRFEDGLLEQLVRTLARQFESDFPPDLLYTESLTETFLLHLIHRHSDIAVASQRRRHCFSEPRVSRAVEFIQANLSQALSVAQIASEADLNTSQFCNVFKNDGLHSTPIRVTAAGRRGNSPAKGDNLISVRDRATGRIFRPEPFDAYSAAAPRSDASSGEALILPCHDYAQDDVSAIELCARLPPLNPPSARLQIRVAE